MWRWGLLLTVMSSEQCGVDCSVVGADFTAVDRATAALQSLQDNYYSVGSWGCAITSSKSEGRRGAPLADSWWHCGNDAEALSNYDAYLNTSQMVDTLDAVWRAGVVEFPVRLNFAGIDDIQWWGIAWVRAFETTGDRSWLSRSEKIHEEAVGYWDDHCNGGLWWNRKKTYKNAITNELFLVLSAKLFKATNDTKYLDWAQKEWAWFETSGMINPAGQVQDGLTDSCGRTGTCYTYNQGVIVGGLAELYTITKNATLLQVAARIVNATKIHMTYSDSVLKESCEPSCNADGEQFKGIFMRHLGYLVKVLRTANPALAGDYALWIAKNADSLWNKGRNDPALFGLVWEGPAGTQQDAITQCSGLDLFLAALI